ncbi:PREDICTED: E3 ubiquitin-protein ligase SINA-like 7 [Camelina sativa]|uniref:RING-type E3 ubiquitin transferase n=1 Tax=Camelina sativa TaxID=90675 RepID=A0ABM0TCT0_CAMSA|nr:PREDICTED: E3 ubiquitin-protein ligase SINA-like 7 [Camelina sativa]
MVGASISASSGERTGSSSTSSMVGASISASSGERAGYSSASYMVGASSSASSGQRSDSSRTNVFRTRQTSSSVSPTNGARKRLKMEMDLEVLECSICFETLTIPIFQCDNGHLGCSSCCPKWCNKCPRCALPIGRIRCRAMESVLRSISIPCPNAQFGCTDNVSYGLESTHVNECIFSQCSCPALDCDYTGSYEALWWHYSYGLCVAPRDGSFTYKVPSTVRMNISDKIKIHADRTNELLFAVQCFREPSGVRVTVSCMAPSSPTVGKFSYHLSYTVDGETITYKSQDMKRILEVSFQTPLEHFMLIPHSSLRGDLLEMKLTIEEVNQV